MRNFTNKVMRKTDFIYRKIIGLSLPYSAQKKKKINKIYAIELNNQLY